MSYLINLASIFAIYAILAISMNSITGYTGLVTLAHAAFYGIGAYTTALLLIHGGVNFFVAMLAGIFLAGVVALLIGSVMSKFRGDYYILGSIGFLYIINSIMKNWDSVTGGPLGVAGITRPALFGVSFAENLPFLLLCLTLLILVYWLAKWIVSTPFGRVLKAIREDEEAIAVFGYRTKHFKLLIFMIGCGMAALAGGLFAGYIRYIDPSTFTIVDSVFMLACIIVGGLANVRGAILGTAILVMIIEFSRLIGLPADVAAQLREVIYGVLLIVMMFWRPQGLIGEYKL